jgi:large subunit ribosomal protein L32
MAHPKRRHSSTRRDKRRTHDSLTVKPFYLDADTGVPVLYHRVCLANGMYRGRQVMKGADEE